MDIGRIMMNIGAIILALSYISEMQGILPIGASVYSVANFFGYTSIIIGFLLPVFKK